MLQYLRKSKFLARFWLVLYLSIYLFHDSTLAEPEGLRVDPQSAPKIEPANNRVPIINITEPSKQGISRNTFIEYNVGSQGVIFNNNPDIEPDDRGAIPSYLAKEALFPNESLQGRAAEVILTEVTGGYPSSLLGFTEIYGHSADFIVTNPNGIYCNGANFINANRVTLTTGQPIFDSRKLLQQLSVKKGTIQVVGDGIEMRELQGAKIPDSPLEILSKVIEINGTLQHAKGDVYLYGGEQDFTYKDKQFILQPSAQSKPANKYVAVDANLLGKIQANRIYIIATQQGVGVNSPGLAATGEIEITASGDIKLKEAHTNKDLHVTSQEGNIRQEGSKTIVGQDYYLQAKGKHIILDIPHLQLGGKGQITSKQLTTTPRTKLWAEGEANNHPPLILTVSDKLDNQGSMNVKQLVVSPLQELINTGKLHTQKSLAIESQYIQQTGEIVAIQGDIQLTGYQQFTNQGRILSQQGTLKVQGGLIQNTGKLSAKKQLNLLASSLGQRGTIEGEGVKLDIKGSLDNSKDIYSQGDLTIKSGTLNNRGEIKVGGQLNIEVNSLEQQGLIKGRGVKLAVQGALNNSKGIYSQRGLSITSGQLHNLGKVITKGHLAIKGQTIQNDGVLHTQEENITLDFEGTITNTSEISSKLGDITIKTPVQLANQGKVMAYQDMNMEAGVLANRGTMQATTGNLTIKAQELLTNQGKVIAYQDVSIETDSLANDQVIQATTGAATIKATHQLTNQQGAVLTSVQDLVLQGPEITNQGKITSGAAIDLTVNKLSNPKEGIIQATGWKSKPFQEFINQGELTITHDIELVTDELTNTGILASQQGGLKIQVNQDLENEKDITSKGAQDIHVTGKLTN